MNKLLDRIWLSRWKHALLPLSFLFGSLLNFGFYYLGLAYQDNPARTYGFIIGQMLFAVLCGLAFLAAMRHARLNKRAWAGLLLFLLFYCANFAAGFLRLDMNSHWKDYFVHFVCFSAPALLAGVFAALSHAEQRLLPLMEKLSFFVLPAGMIYLNGLLFYCNPFGYNRYLGIVDYMGFAYTVMPFLLVHIIQFCDRAPLELPVCKRSVSHPQLLRGAMIAIYWVDIIGSGTRGTYVCVAGFCVLLVLSKLIHKDGAPRAFMVSAALAAVLGVNTQDMLDELESRDVNHQVATSEVPTEKPSDEPSEPTKDVAAENLAIGSRGTLYKLAWKEFLKSPLTGMGLSGYAVKYSHYPHNVILELLCEGGLLLGAPILLRVLWALLRMLCLAN